jgi:hypothetical protein
MIGRSLLLVVLMAAVSLPAQAQTKPAPPPPQPGAPQKPAKPTTLARAAQPFGGVMFQAKDSFDAVLGSNTGPSFGGGGQVLLPWGLYAEAAAWRFTNDGERVFVGPNQEVFPLGIPLEVTLTPLEITGGWRYRHCPAPPRNPKTPPARVAAMRPCAPRLIPYVGGGLSSYKYAETSQFSTSDEDVNARFNGFHLLGGAEYRVHRWVGVSGEVAWSSVKDALGAGGVSAAFDENNLGGATFRMKISVGR